MPKITISATLIRITRSIQPGQWLMLHPDEHYDILTHEQAMALQGKAIRGPITKNPIRKIEMPPTSTSTVINGKTLTVQPQKLAILQYMAAHGQLTTAEATVLLGTPKPTSILSTLKNLGFVASKATGKGQGDPHIYSLTNEGRAIAQGSLPAETTPSKGLPPALKSLSL